MIRGFVLRLITKIEVRRPFRLEDIAHSSVSINRPGDLDL